MKRLALILMLLATPLMAVEPDEVLSDPVLEQRALNLRLLVRERLVEGDSDTEVIDYIVARYGEFVLLKPTFGGANWVLWAAGPLMLLLSSLVGIAYLRGRSRAKAPQDEGLSDSEKAALRDILDK